MELSHLQDPNSGSHYTVKEYESGKLFKQTGEWAHDLIRLKPLSFDEGYKVIELREDEVRELRVIGESGEWWRDIGACCSLCSLFFVCLL